MINPSQIVKISLCALTFSPIFFPYTSPNLFVQGYGYKFNYNSKCPIATVYTYLVTIIRRILHRIILVRGTQAQPQACIRQEMIIWQPYIMCNICYVVFMIWSILLITQAYSKVIKCIYRKKKRSTKNWNMLINPLPRPFCSTFTPLVYLPL